MPIILSENPKISRAEVVTLLEKHVIRCYKEYSNYIVNWYWDDLRKPCNREKPEKFLGGIGALHTTLLEQLAKTGLSPTEIEEAVDGLKTVKFHDWITLAVKHTLINYTFTNGSRDYDNLQAQLRIEFVYINKNHALDIVHENPNVDGFALPKKTEAVKLELDQQFKNELDIQFYEYTKGLDRKKEPAKQPTPKPLLHSTAAFFSLPQSTVSFSLGSAMPLNTLKPTPSSGASCRQEISSQEVKHLCEAINRVGDLKNTQTIQGIDNRGKTPDLLIELLKLHNIKVQSEPKIDFKKPGVFYLDIDEENYRKLLNRTEASVVQAYIKNNPLRDKTGREKADRAKTLLDKLDKGIDLSQFKKYVEDLYDEKNLLQTMFGKPGKFKHMLDDLMKIITWKESRQILTSSVSATRS